MPRGLALLLVVALPLAACGTTPEDRAISGAGIGAAGGAIVGAVTGISVAAGAVLGAAAGGAIGALTDTDTVDLGEPIWKKKRAAAGTRSVGAAGSETVRDIQSNLARMGYDPGPVDGVAGPRTRAAIRRYQRDHGLAADGRATVALALHTYRQAERPQQAQAPR